MDWAMLPAASQPAPEYDIAIIGAGVVGCAAFRSFVLAGARTLLLERDPDIVNGASKGNSGLLHTGFDAAPGSREARCIQCGHREYRLVHERLNLPLMETSAVMVAWNEQERQRLAAISPAPMRTG